jgi:uncharacterized protein
MHDDHTLLISLIPADKGQDTHLVLSAPDVKQLMPDTCVGEATSALTLDMHLQRRPSTGRVLISGHVRADFTLSCSRCLQPTPWTLDSDMAVTLMPLSQQPKDDELELTDTDLDVTFYTEDTLKITDILSESLLLELPSFPLCREDCAGLCPQCGRSLSAENVDDPCRCSPEPTHLGLAALQERLKS